MHPEVPARGEGGTSPADPAHAAPTPSRTPAAPTAEVTRPAPPTAATAFRLAVVPGVNPAKWLRVWAERLPDVPLELVHLPPADAQDALRAGSADAGLLREPVDRAALTAIPLYTETTVVVVPTDHVVVAADEVTTGDLADDVLLLPADDVLPWAAPPRDAPRHPGRHGLVPAPATTADAVDLVAAGAGVLVVPQSLARLHHRRDLTSRPVADAPTSSVVLAWVTDAGTDLVEELIGIVRGRTVNSSRGRGAGTRDGQAADRPDPTASRSIGGGGPAAGSQRRSGGRKPGTDNGGGAGGSSRAGRTGGRGPSGGGPRASGGRRAPGGRGGTGRSR